MDNIYAGFSIPLIMLFNFFVWYVPRLCNSPFYVLKIMVFVDLSIYLRNFLVFTEYGDVSAYRLSLTEDTKAINQLVHAYL